MTSDFDAHAHRFYHLHRPLFFHLLISVIYTAVRISNWARAYYTALLFFSRLSSRFTSLVSSKDQPSAGFHSDLISMVAVASHRLASFLREKRPTSRNVTSDIRETKCTMRHRERDRATTAPHRALEPHRKLTLDEIAPLLVLRYCENSWSEKFIHARKREKEYELTNAT